MTRHPRKHIPLGADNFLSVLEGIEGGFAIFVGIIAGLYFQNVSHDLLVVTGAIGLIVNAFNSSAVRYASEHYIDEVDGHEKRHKLHAYFVPAFVEFLTYALVSFIAVLPLLLIRDSLFAIGLTSVLTVIILYAAGWYRGTLFGRHAKRDGIELAGLGVAIIFVGAAAGWILSRVVA
jgi:VIT1/CCC1 family predicted Fe2+/Mn2+ transporter